MAEDLEGGFAEAVPVFGEIHHSAACSLRLSNREVNREEELLSRTIRQAYGSRKGDDRHVLHATGGPFTGKLPPGRPG
jgi:hypothetical protein